MAPASAAPARPPGAIELAPVAAGARIDREAFRRTVHVPALRVTARQCHEVVRLLRGKHMLDIPRIKAVAFDGGGEKGGATSNGDPPRRLVLLREGTERSALAPAAAALLFGGGEGEGGEGATAPGPPAPLSPPAEWVPSVPVALDYSHATLEQVLRAVLPSGGGEAGKSAGAGGAGASADAEVPSAFECVGGIAHVNLRPPWLPYRLLVGEALLDKNPTVDVVVNKVGTIESEYRVFRMEVIAERERGGGGASAGGRKKKQQQQAAAGDDPAAASPTAETKRPPLPYVPASLETVVTQCGVRFSLDFAAVYWNSRLETEHARLVQRYFLPGQTVADAMCGVGPFAVPAALLPNGGARVLANDLNPAAARYAARNAALNRVARRVAVFNVDGRLFMRAALAGRGELPEGAAAGEGGWPAAAPDQKGPAPATREREPRERGPPWPPRPEEVGTRPPVDHIVLNLPASAVEFLDALSGACDPSLSSSSPSPWRRRAGGGGGDGGNNAEAGEALPLPLVHVYTFQKDETEGGVLRRVERAMGRRLDGSPLPDDGDEHGENDDDAALARASRAGAAVHRVRDVAPNKLMLCVTFRVPPECAFAGRLPADAGEAAKVCAEFRAAGLREEARAARARDALKEQLEAEERARLAARTPKGGGGDGGGGGANKKARTAAAS